MEIELKKNKDFWSGLMLIIIGAGAMFLAKDYRFGSALNMGPGFFPSVLGGILFAFGIITMVVGLRSGEKIRGNLSIRAIILLPLSLVLFGILVEHVGFIPALTALILVAAAAGRQFKFAEVLPLAALLIVVSIGVFIWGLGLPYPLIKGF